MPLLAGIEQAKETIHIVIFRFDRGEIEAALKRAVRRGVFVHALVAHTMTGQGGEKMLRKLEMQLLEDGITVARTDNDLARYHDKLMIIDKKILYLLGFNFTYLDMERSRSFGIVTTSPSWVREAERLFMADTLRQPYTPACDTFLVSPGNSRRQLTAMLMAARRQLLIYDGKLTDPDVMAILAAKVRQGVEVKVIGSVGKRAAGVQTAAPPMRLHAQAIVRDGEEMFLGSQSLRSLELDARREVGVIVKDPALVRQVTATFEADWAKAHGEEPGDLLPVEPQPVIDLMRDRLPVRTLHRTTRRMLPIRAEALVTNGHGE
jgi:phosphatidylserine/phosphatidylglycerophosphate/cardiolipin synthase-like enzyme